MSEMPTTEEERAVLDRFMITPLQWVRILRPATVGERLHMAFSIITDGACAEVRAGHTELARLVSSSREAICRALRDWRERDWIEVRRGGGRDGGSVYALRVAFYEQGPTASVQGRHA